MDRFESAKKTVRALLESPHTSFYRDRYGTSPSYETKAAWAQLPYMHKQDLVNAPLEKRLAIPPSLLGAYRFTSGTSGSGVLMMPVADEPMPLAFSLHGDYPFAHARAVLRFGLRTWVSPHETVIVGDSAHMALSAHMAEHYAIDACIGSVSEVLTFSGHLSEESRAHITKVGISNERCTLLQYRALAHAYPNAEIHSWFAAGESNGPLAVSTTPGAYPFVFEALPTNYVEVVGDNGNVLEHEGAEGTLVLTTFFNQGTAHNAFPVVRYHTGDRVRIVQHQKDLFQFHALGRIQGSEIKVSGGSISVAAVEQALATLSDAHIVDFEGVVSEVPGTPLPCPALHLILFTTHPDEYTPSELRTLENRISTVLHMGRHTTYAQAVEKGVVAPLRITTEKTRLSDSHFKRRHLTDLR